MAADRKQRIHLAVTDITLSSPPPPARAGASRQNIVDRLFSGATLLFALFVLLLLGSVIVSLVIGSWPALRTFGFGFITSEAWNPNPARPAFGALVPIYGTLVTSAIALVIGVPLSFGVAVFITEFCPPILKRPVGVAIELLAGIPSIIYGIWGLFVFAPILQAFVQPLLIATLGRVPVIGALFAGPPFGIGVLTAGIILAIMILPFITAITRDVFQTVPLMLKESAYGLGCTTWEVVWNVVLPFTRIGVVGGVMLGLGRALGETMAVTFVIGNAHQIHASLLAPGTTISAALANEYAEATFDLYSSSLVALGLILFVITFFVLGAAKLLLRQVEKRSGT